MDTIGIIAGSGQFPFLVARGAKRDGLRVVICGFHGNTDDALAAEADAFTMLHLGQLGALIAFFKRHHARSVCMAGAVSKPKALDLRPDMRAARLLFQLKRNKGDDAVLRAVADELHSEGITVVRPERLVPNLRGPVGVLGKHRPRPDTWRDIRFGWNIAKSLGALDIGQCVVVRSGIVVAVEAMEGTDATLIRGGELGGSGCTAVKVLKPGQDDRLDLPSIGAGTIALLAGYRYACLAFEAEKTLFFDRQAALDTACEHSIAVVGLPADNGDFPEMPPS
ncbi:MAG: UDP-2,3-diacylglucosamine diphosphatase LpxI [Desulfovibrio sp.]|jgi:DUF1009 family protein|nr:UDP-2,3-diacylglucosamine diphosphatase LpxI [Desulfovibrio sp.]